MSNHVVPTLEDRIRERAPQAYYLHRAGYTPHEIALTLSIPVWIVRAHINAAKRERRYAWRRVA